MATQLQLTWHVFPIDLEDFTQYVQTVASSTFDGVTCDETYLTIIFNTDISQVIADDITAHFNSLAANSEALKAAISIKRAEVNALRDTKLNSGFTWNGNNYDSDEISKLNVTATLSGVNSGITLPPTFTWRNANNQNIPMTTEEFKTFALSMLYWAQTIYGVSWYHKSNIESLTTDVNNYNITAGW